MRGGQGTNWRQGPSRSTDDVVDDFIEVRGHGRRRDGSLRALPAQSRSPRAREEQSTVGQGQLEVEVDGGENAGHVIGQWWRRGTSEGRAADPAGHAGKDGVGGPGLTFDADDVRVGRLGRFARCHA